MVPDFSGRAGKRSIVLTGQSSRDFRRVANKRRVERLIKAAIVDFSLDLTDIAVLTEAASGPFAVTPLIAALAGAPRVIAVTRDSKYGTVAEVSDYVLGWAAELGVAERIQVTDEPARRFAEEANLVTNLGFVRPIDAEFVSRLPRDSAIPLMWEPWEFRSEDLDLSACLARGIPVLGTDESHPRLRIFRYVGMIVLKLLFAAEIEIFRSNILLVGSGPFGDEAQVVLEGAGGIVTRVCPDDGWSGRDGALDAAVLEADALVVVEHRQRMAVIGGDRGIPVSWLAERAVSVIHVCGVLDMDALAASGIAKFPPHDVRPGYMALTTDFVGPRPVVDLHAAGLKVGEVLVRGLRRHGHPDRAISEAVATGLALDFQDTTATAREEPS